MSPYLIIYLSIDLTCSLIHLSAYLSTYLSIHFSPVVVVGAAATLLPQFSEPLLLLYPWAWLSPPTGEEAVVVLCVANSDCGEDDWLVVVALENPPTPAAPAIDALDDKEENWLLLLLLPAHAVPSFES